MKRKDLEKVAKQGAIKKVLSKKVPKKIDATWKTRFCRECTYFNKNAPCGKNYYYCMYSSRPPVHGNMKACEYFISKDVVKKKLKPEKDQMEDSVNKQEKLVKKNCYSVELESTNCLHTTANTKNFGYIDVDKHGFNGVLIVFAEDAEEVGKLFPEAIEIKLLGVGYVKKEA